MLAERNQFLLATILAVTLASTAAFCLSSVILFQQSTPPPLAIEIVQPKILGEWPHDCTLSFGLWPPDDTTVVFYAHCGHNVAFTAGTVSVDDLTYSNKYELSSLEHSYKSLEIPIEKFHNNHQARSEISISFADLADAGASESSGGRTTFYYSAQTPHVLSVSFNNTFLLNLISYSQEVNSLNIRLYIVSYLFAILGCSITMSLSAGRSRKTEGGNIGIIIPSCFVFFVSSPAIRYWGSLWVTGVNTPFPFLNVLGGGDSVIASIFLGFVSLPLILLPAIAVSSGIDSILGIRNPFISRAA
jgi:hypothetical protein